MENKTEYLSLYDFLGKPAGTTLGKEISNEAKKQGISTQTRKIANPKFTGNVILYPKTFLEFYFRKPDSLQIYDFPEGFDSRGNMDDNELPF